MLVIDDTQQFTGITLPSDVLYESCPSIDAHTNHGPLPPRAVVIPRDGTSFASLLTDTSGIGTVSVPGRLAIVAPGTVISMNLSANDSRGSTARSLFWNIPRADRHRSPVWIVSSVLPGL